METQDNECANITLDQLKEFHADNQKRIVNIEENLQALQGNTAEIVEWVRNAKLGAAGVAKTFHFLGSCILWSSKVIAAFVALYTAYVTIKAGKLPDWKIFP